MSHYRLTKFEIARIIGVRIEQLSLGAPTKLEYENNDTPDSIAWRELLEGQMPFIIERKNMKTGEPIHIPVSRTVLTNKQHANATSVISRLRKEYHDRCNYISSNRFVNNENT